MPGTIRSVLRGQRPVIRSDGKFIRDYFYVEDGAAAYTFMAEQLAAHPDLRGSALNFSNEEPLSVLEMVERVLGALATDLEPEVLGEASNEIRDQRLSAARARGMGWAPLFEIDDALERTIAWYRGMFEAKS